MKKLLFITLSMITVIVANAQKMKKQTLEQRISDIEDRIAIKNVVDTFSVLADHKDIAKQVLLFAEDGIVASKVNGQPSATFSGRKQIGDAFSAYLALFDVVYHINGQQTVTLNGDTATGISYCAVTLIGKQDGKNMRTSMGVYYNDEFVKQNGKWLIKKRTSNFAWQVRQPMGQ